MQKKTPTLASGRFPTFSVARLLQIPGEAEAEVVASVLDDHLLEARVHAPAAGGHPLAAEGEHRTRTAIAHRDAARLGSQSAKREARRDEEAELRLAGLHHRHHQRKADGEQRARDIADLSKTQAALEVHAHARRRIAGADRKRVA